MRFVILRAEHPRDLPIQRSCVAVRGMRTRGCVPEWPNGADCKSAVFRLRWFESIRTHYYFAEVFCKTSESLLLQLDAAKTCARFGPSRQKSCGNSSVDRALAFQAGGRGFESRFPLLCCFSSVVERILGKDEVPSSTLGSSSNRVANANSGPQSQIIRLVNGQTLADLF